MASFLVSLPQVPFQSIMRITARTIYIFIIHVFNKDLLSNFVCQALELDT